jgi:predicted acetyltransferase
MVLDIRTVDAERFDAFHAALAAAFSSGLSPEELEFERKIAEFDRILAAYDGEEIVGGAVACSFELTVPGAIVRAAGVTGVGVKPSHRRLGINTALMRRQLDDIRERGSEPLAILYASEGGIYQRFGYGVATWMTEISIESERTRFLTSPVSNGRVRMLAREPALEAMAAVYDRVRPLGNGLLSRSPDRWNRIIREHLHGEENADQLFYAVHDGPDGPDAYAAYRVKQEWPGEIPSSTLKVDELMADSPGAYADMWRFLFDVDLVAKIGCWNRPIDDPLLHLLVEPRRLRMQVRDGLHVRVVDVPRALAARRYAAQGRVVLEVRDEFCPWNDGRYELEVARDGAAGCRRTGAAADVVLAATELGSAYLGGMGFRALHRAGLVDEERDGALARADSIFASDPAPWCANMF